MIGASSFACRDWRRGGFFKTEASKYNEKNDTPTEQAIQHIQGGAGPGVPAGVLHGARGAARDGAGRDAGGGRCCKTTEYLVEGPRRAGAVGGLRGAGLLQVHGSPLGDEGDACYQRDARRTTARASPSRASSWPTSPIVSTATCRR